MTNLAELDALVAGFGALWGIRDIYLDARNGVAFSRTFQDHTAIGLQEYEDQYWDLIRVR